MAAKRKRGGGILSAKNTENNGKREPGTFHKFDSAAKVAKLGTKTKSDGFAKGGAIDADGIARMPAREDDKAMMKKGGAAKRKDGGAISGSAPAPSLAKRARGGRTSAPFSNVHVPMTRAGNTKSGHENE